MFENKDDHPVDKKACGWCEVVYDKNKVSVFY